MKRLNSPEELARVLDFRHGAEVAQIRLRAAATPWDGRGPLPATQRLLVKSQAEPGMKISMLYSFDYGPHTSGWWANSDYNACRHLSIVGITGNTYADVPELELKAWARIWFGTDTAKAWNEPPAPENDPYRDAPASRHTHHIRVFIDQRGNSFIPEGEVYTLKPFADGSSPEKIFRR